MPPPDTDTPETTDDIVRLPANGTTATAEHLRDALVHAGNAGDATRIDGSAVETVGQAVLQLLLAAARGAAAAGKGFEIIDASAALRERIGACQLAEALGISSDEAVAA